MVNINEGAALWGLEAAGIGTMVEEAARTSRLRCHRLIHADHADQVQRLVIAAVRGSYFRPHRHPEQWELLVLIDGRGRLLHFSGDGTLASELAMAKGAVNVAQIAPDRVHGFFVDGDHAVVLEVKPGPFRPNVFAEWAPEEGTEGVGRYLDWIAGARAGMAWKAAAV